MFTVSDSSPGSAKDLPSYEMQMCRLSQPPNSYIRAVAPVAECVAQALWNSIRKSASKGRTLPTRLTQRRRSEGRGNEFAKRLDPMPRWAKICEICGAESVKNRYCKSSAVEVSTENKAQVALIGHSRPKNQRVKNRISKTISDHAVTNTCWDSKSLPSWLTQECYVRRIQPLLRAKKVREIAGVMQVSQPYAALIRAGRRRPHPRHWQALGRLAGVFSAQS